MLQTLVLKSGTKCKVYVLHYNMALFSLTDVKWLVQANNDAMDRVT